MVSYEHMDSIAISQAGTYLYPIPKGGQIVGLYSDVPVTLQYNDNGSVGTMVRTAQVWEPPIPFMPAPTAYLQIVTTSKAEITVRYRV